MNFLRNTLGIVVGLAVAGLIITIAVRINPEWLPEDKISPFQNWNNFLKNNQNNHKVFWVILFSSGIAASIGGVATAIIVKYAKVAYAILIGFILLFLAMLDIIIFPYHPTFYKILIFLTFFPFSWIGGKLTDVLFNRRQKKINNSK